MHVFRALVLRFIICAQSLRLAMYKGLHAHWEGLYKRVAAGAGLGSRTLRVELGKMLNIS